MNVHLPTTMRWVDSTGGPLMLLPKVLLPFWSGINPSSHPDVEGVTFRWKGDPDGPVTDYDRACSIDDYQGMIEVGDGKALILGGEPMSAAWLPLDDGGLIVRWGYANDEAAALRAINALGDEDFQPSGLSLAVKASPILLMDSASPGSHPSVETESLPVDLAPGDFQVGMADFRPDPSTWFIVHRLRLPGKEC